MQFLSGVDMSNTALNMAYVVAGLAQLGRNQEAQAALAELRQLDKDLSSFERLARRLYRDGAAVDHILEGLRKAGSE